jgi:membrane protease YdiL (CAAX protease family)
VRDERGERSTAPGPTPAALTPFLTPGVELVLAARTFFCALVLVLATPGLQSAIFAALDAIFGRPDLPADKLRQAHAVVLTPLATLLAALIYRLIGDRIDRVEGMPPAAIQFPPAPTGPLGTSREVALHLVLAVAGSWVLSVIMHLLGAPVAEQTLVLELTASGDLRRPELAILAFSALALAPLAEELFFRGQLLRRTWRRGGPRAAYLASALLFAAFHGNLQGFVVYTWLALVFASAYARTGRLSAAIAVHLGNNAVTLALLLLAPPT